MQSNLHHILNKPFLFKGKTIQFFGDSITMGHTSGISLTEEGFPYVIFIAPINRLLQRNNQMAELNDYRKVICEYCISFEYDFINGGLFHFPEENGEICALIMSEGLHPSEHGYRLYAKELAGILC